jgi:hypothetical protein
VYDPHIVPTVERWQAQYAASRARRRQRLVAVEAKGKRNDPTSAGTELQSLGRKRNPGAEAEERISKESENIVAKEVDEWRSGVDRSQTVLRHRTNVGTSGSALEEVSFDILKCFDLLLTID